MRIIIGNALFGILVLGWYLRSNGDHPTFLAGAVLALLAFIAGTCMGFLLSSAPAKHRPLSLGRRPTRGAAATTVGNLDGSVFDDIR
jgi:hypothetical protein